MMRRDFIATLGGAAAMWPLVARAQQTRRIYRIGFLANDPTIPSQPAWQAFLDGLRESGFVEGENILIERRFAGARLDQSEALLAELTRLQVELIVTGGDATLAAKQANTTIPVVMLNVSDPIGRGIVVSLAHPGGNITVWLRMIRQKWPPGGCNSSRTPFHILHRR
jgi:putative ABC transport system substrate-binding protein